MNSIRHLQLNQGRPEDRAHLLVWDTPNHRELETLAFEQNAKIVDYRHHLLARQPPGERFVLLHLHLEREIAELKGICAAAIEPIVILTGLDCLITYLSARRDSPLRLFWSKLEQTRKLESRLWIVLPSKLVPSDWDKNRQHAIG
ncbi:hypothetical protein [Oxynema aestuarii]|uniref:Uncharacterized protein n=1 Tax=Oxynema aestuarii AP17 TaxID=2064643 RepID=A0A6H1U168_9CYAN|nr:hypothetical protein [Oxynema aestuarii]QIZ72618.1 hypothetical protein HCG48_20150 [Oxynema aestuarii AP17]